MSVIAQNKNGFVLRLATLEDADPFYDHLWANPNPEVLALTGTRHHFSRSDIQAHFRAIEADPNRLDLMILAPNGTIIGESVINEYDALNQNANFRIAIYDNQYLNQDIGSWVIQETLHYAFSHMTLHRIGLDVFDFNLRAQKAYTKAGFQVEGRLRQAHKQNDQFVDIIIMAILKDDFYAVKASKGEGRA